ncbi:MAG TPA: PAS domain-containing protein [Terriglobales bacterium]|nr:PAS domain-containing protein [Terriglobales bacterium]
MRLLTNPILLRMAGVAAGAALAFLLGWFLIRQMRRSLQEERKLGEGDPANDSFPLHTYHAVIQELKQQKYELQALQQAERRRSKTSENISGAVLSNLSCGVLFFNVAGLLKQANHAGKKILGFASPVGMNARELFRETHVQLSRRSFVKLSDALASTLKDAVGFHETEADYLSPTGEARVLDVIVSPVYAADGELLGAACLLNDRTDIACLRREQAIHGEISAEMALQLRNSVSLISEYAETLAGGADARQTQQLAKDIRSEAEHLQQTIGGFLSGRKTFAASAAR